jgi:hypothetical protein
MHLQRGPNEALEKKASAPALRSSGSGGFSRPPPPSPRGSWSLAQLLAPRQPQPAPHPRPVLRPAPFFAPAHEKGPVSWPSTTRSSSPSSILLCGSESRSLTQKQRDKLRSFHRGCVRSMCLINMWHVQEHRITAQELKDRLGVRSFETHLVRTAASVARACAEHALEPAPTPKLAARGGVGQEMTYGRSIPDRGSALSGIGRGGVPRSKGRGRAGRASGGR